MDTKTTICDSPTDSRMRQRSTSRGSSSQRRPPHSSPPNNDDIFDRRRSSVSSASELSVLVNTSSSAVSVTVSRWRGGTYSISVVSGDSHHAHENGSTADELPIITQIRGSDRASQSLSSLSTLELGYPTQSEAVNEDRQIPDPYHFTRPSIFIRQKKLRYWRRAKPLANGRYYIVNVSTGRLVVCTRQQNKLALSSKLFGCEVLYL
jgi:hypothetical protein